MTQNMDRPRSVPTNSCTRSSAILYGVLFPKGLLEGLVGSFSSKARLWMTFPDLGKIMSIPNTYTIGHKSIKLNEI
jgi:hypothetical protein